ncbi:PAS domain-containing protein [Metabacillus sp. GX 13764]|uniref:PAS domain-containing protein n=1 Tax=Metabacillus kandeliae TaxID=2900151 RepID=UPI001E44925E|nr:STAS domain-containing protein [Metabacillus kandeliae]MCD7035526.1 PAS domain-containing protein [Metabacillus kandeliae]
MESIQEIELIRKTLNSTSIGVVITDPSLHDNPIVYVNQGFLNLTLYSREETQGENCRFLQGAETDPGAIEKIKTAVREKRYLEVEILNYRKDGTAFWNELIIEPIFIESEKKHYFVGFQKDITKQKVFQAELAESLDQIRELSTPIVPLSEDVSILPLIGELTAERSESVIEKATAYISSHQNKFLIVDLSGISRVEQDEIANLLKLYQVLSLMGTEMALSGVSAEFILSSTPELFSHLGNIKTFMTVKEALHSLNQL